MNDLLSFVNSPGLWVVSSFMIIVILTQATLFFRAAWKEAKKINFPREKMIRAIRAAAITAIGPSLSPVIIMMALITVLGVPTTWMRMNDIGASRTELAVTTMVAGLVGAEPGGAGWDANTFGYALWGMALNNAMWMLVALLFTAKMGKMLSKMNSKYDPRLVNLVMDGAALGLFGILLSAQVIFKSTANVAGAIFSAITMVIIVRFVALKIPFLREPALGISMLVGMFIAAGFFA